MPLVKYKLSPRMPQPVVGPSGQVYRFRNQGINNWCVEDVSEGDVQAVLNTKRGCCGSRGKFFRLMTQEEIAAWEQNTLYRRR